MDPTRADSPSSPFPRPAAPTFFPLLSATMTKPTMPTFRKRERREPIVCRDAGVPHPANDLDDSRAYVAGETVELRLDVAMPAHHPDSLRAVVVANGERVTVRALHAVFARDRGRLVNMGDEFDVGRDRVFVVWR